MSRAVRRFKSFRRGSGANSRLMVWTSTFISQSMTTGTQVDDIICDVASFGTTSGNTKHAGTLLRIRGHISVLDGSEESQFAWGICQCDVAETVGGNIQSVLSVDYGADEDVLAWEVMRIPPDGSNTVGQGVMNFHIDIKSKRRMDVESNIVMSYRSTTGTVVAGNVRCLVLVP